MQNDENHARKFTHSVYGSFLLLQLSLFFYLSRRFGYRYSRTYLDASW